MMIDWCTSPSRVHLTIHVYWSHLAPGLPRGLA